MVECGSCGLPLARLEVGLCRLCRVIAPVADQPDAAAFPSERVLPDIETPRKDTAA